MQRFSLLLGLVALAVTLGLLWRTEDTQQPPTVAQLEIDGARHEPVGFLQLLKKDLVLVRHGQVIGVNEETEEDHPFLFPTDQMYRSIPQSELPFQRR